MDKLKTLQHSVAKFDNRCNILTKYTWKFYDSDNILKILEYQYSIYYVNTLNKQTRIREDIQHVTERYSLSSFEKKSINEEKIVPKNIIALGLVPATKKPSR